LGLPPFPRTEQQPLSHASLCLRPLYPIVTHSIASKTNLDCITECVLINPRYHHLAVIQAVPPPIRKSQSHREYRGNIRKGSGRAAGDQGKQASTQARNAQPACRKVHHLDPGLPLTGFLLPAILVGASLSSPRPSATRARIGASARLASSAGERGIGIKKEVGQWAEKAAWEVGTSQKSP
jgi:hypothetical protein